MALERMVMRVFMDEEESACGLLLVLDDQLMALA